MFITIFEKKGTDVSRKFHAEVDKDRIDFNLLDIVKFFSKDFFKNMSHIQVIIVRTDADGKDK